MPTSTFERKIVIDDPKGLEILQKMEDDRTPLAPISTHPFSYEDRRQGEELLKNCSLREDV